MAAARCLSVSQPGIPRFRRLQNKNLEFEASIHCKLRTYLKTEKETHGGRGGGVERERENEHTRQKAVMPFLV